MKLVENDDSGDPELLPDDDNNYAEVALNAAAESAAKAKERSDKVKADALKKADATAAISAKLKSKKG